MKLESILSNVDFSTLNDNENIHINCYRLPRVFLKFLNFIVEDSMIFIVEGSWQGDNFAASFKEKLTISVLIASTYALRKMVS